MILPSRLLRPAALAARLAATLALGAASLRAQTASAPVTLSTLAGQAGASGHADGSGSAARFLNPSGLVLDRQGNLFVADSGNNTIRKITPAGVVTTFAGRAVDPDSGLPANGGTADGTGADAAFKFGQSIIDSIGSNTLAIDANDNIYVADTLNNAIRKITPGAVVTTLSLRDSGGVAVTLNSPDGVAIDPSANLYVTESGTNTIRRISLTGVVSTLAGALNVAGNDDGTGAAARFNNPRGIAVDGAGNVYVSDTNNNTIRRITPGGVVTTIAGSPVGGPPTRNSVGSSDGLGRNARFNAPVGLAVDTAGNLYIADRGNSSVRKLTAAGVVSTIAGLSGTAGSADGTGNAARLRQPYSVAVDSVGNLFVSDTKNQTVRRGVAATSAPSLALTAQPQIQIVNTGQAASFSVAATGSPAPAYQWQRNGVAIAGAAGSTYTLLSPALSDDRTYYTVVVTSGTLSFTSNSAQLQVFPPSVPIPPVIILTQPFDQITSAGTGVTLSVEATGNGPVTYQWQKGTTNIVGATSADYNIPSPQTSDSGLYQVIVTNGSAPVSANNPLTSNTAALTVNAVAVVPVTITTHPVSQSASAGQSASFSVAASGTPAPTYQWQKDGNNISGATAFSFTILTTSAADAGSYRVVVTNSAGSITSNAAVLTVTAAAIAPAIVTQPAAQAVTAGQPATFSVAATGTPAPIYQWQKDGVSIPGATAATYTIAAAQSGDAAGYRVIVSNSAGAVTSAIAALSVAPAFIDPARLINLSILAPLVSGETMTMGTVLGGSGTTSDKPLVARAAGPALTQLGVTGVLPDPRMKLNRTSTTPAVVIAQNDDWGGSTALGTAFAQVGAFAYASAASKDAGIYESALASGNYTIEVNDAGTGAGTVIAELYDATPNNTFAATTPRLINVSVLKTIAAGSSMTAGFVVGGAATTSLRVLVRAVGPTLGAAPFDISGVMSDPKIELFRSSTKIDENDNWGGSAALTSAFTSVGAFQLAGATTRDAVLFVSLAPGQYSARVSGADGGGGVAIVEVYEVP